MQKPRRTRKEPTMVSTGLGASGSLAVNYSLRVPAEFAE